MTRNYAIAGSVVALAVVAGLAAAVFVGRGTDDPFAKCRGSAVSGGPGTIGGPFTLIDESGRQVTDKDVIKGPTLVYFGYTFCPDICPADTARNAAAVDILEERGYEVTPVFISVDPGRDTPAILKEWTDYVHPRMLGLTGTEAEVTAAAKAYRSYFKVPDDRSDPYYIVDHSTFTYLMLPSQGFVDFFDRDVPPDAMADRISCFLEAAK